MTVFSIDQQFKKVAPEVRPIVKAARDLVRGVAPKAVEVPYDSKPPAAKSFMWKLARYTVAGNNVVGIGTFSRHSALFFYRGRELDDGSGLLQGSGKDSRFITLRSVADAESPAVRRLVQKAFRLAASNG